MLGQLITSGVDVLRLNMAHGSGDWAKTLIERVRKVSKDLDRHVAVMMDVKGPEIRTGVVESPIELAVGDLFEFYTDVPTPGLRGVSVNYPGLPTDVSVGATILVDSGLMRLEVRDLDATHVRCKVLTSGKLGSRRHVNLPGMMVNLPSLTEKDERDVRAGVEAGIDFVALSFVRKSDDILLLRDFLDSLGSKARIIAKIEDQSGVRNMHSIIKATDAVMVARGDLGIEIDYHTLPLVQTQLVDLCLKEGKAGDYRHALVGVDDQRAHADARRDLRHFDGSARTRGRGDAVRRDHHRSISARVRRRDEEDRRYHRAHGEAAVQRNDRARATEIQDATRRHRAGA